MTMEVMPEMEAVEDPCAPNLEPLYIPKLPVTLGDSGWRIFLDDLSEERLRASYEDTMQYINVEKPEDSLLLAYGRGEIYITGVYGGKKGRLHPRVYPSALGDACTLEALPMANINETDMNLMGTDMGMEDTMEEKALSKSEIVYQRMSSWAALSHKYFTGIGLFNLEVYQNNAQALIEGSCFCHGKETEGTAIEPSFEFMRGSLEEASGVASLAPLINPNQPEKSALIRMAFEEYEHPPIGALPDYEQAMLSWIEKL